MRCSKRSSGKARIARRIDEIIRLSKKYKFVTPYTSFLAVPRALLRPRVIRPGDPVLRLKADESIVSVIALFPFGLTKPLRYLKEEDTWQTRFLAPVDMSDGEYQVRLILRDRDGHVYRESKSFVIASKTPVLRARLEKPRVHAGETMRISAQASGNARTITARLYGAMPVALRWNSAAKANTGEIVVPAYLPPGKYTIHVTAEDIAHNVGTRRCRLKSGKRILIQRLWWSCGAFADSRRTGAVGAARSFRVPRWRRCFAAFPCRAAAVPILRPPAESAARADQSDLRLRLRDFMLYRLRAQEAEVALDFIAAEADWKTYAENAADRYAAQIELADFYHRRARPREELAALTAAAAAERRSARSQPLRNRVGSAFERMAAVIEQEALPPPVAEPVFRAWVARYPKEPAAWRKLIEYLARREAIRRGRSRDRRLWPQLSRRPSSR